MFDPEALRASALWLWLQGHPAWIGAAICAIAFVESFAIAGIVVPGVALLALCALAAGAAAVPAPEALAWAFAGAVLGDGSSFLIGRRLGPALRERRPLSTHREWLTRGEAFFERHGVLGVVLGRFVGPIRPVMPLIAGMLRMAPARFLVVNLASAVAWAPVYVLPGYLVGASVAEALVAPPFFLPGALLLLVLLWLSTRATLVAWRAGGHEGALARAMAARLGTRAAPLLTPLAPDAGLDTRLSLIAAAATLCLCLGAILAVLAFAPALSDWRTFALDLWHILRRLPA
ncbi:MAG: DedA family protein [Pseudomonadales bacterium]|nr:DedA family protein [Pseudomonadales bacterium]